MADYDVNDIFNADETGVFYQRMPNRTLASKGSPEALLSLLTVFCSFPLAKKKRKQL
jgi:hypothetical protein